MTKNAAVSVSPPAVTLDTSLRELAQTLKPAQRAALAAHVAEQERRLQAAVAKVTESTSAVYAIYAEIQAARSVLS
jgi:hypothetical protein